MIKQLKQQGLRTAMVMGCTDWSLLIILVPCNWPGAEFFSLFDSTSRPCFHLMGSTHSLIPCPGNISEVHIGVETITLYPPFDPSVCIHQNPTGGDYKLSYLQESRRFKLPIPLGYIIAWDHKTDLLSYLYQTFLKLRGRVIYNYLFEARGINYCQDIWAAIEPKVSQFL